MKKFLNRCRQENVCLNKDKMERNVTEVTFMGHKITRNGLQVDESKIEALKNFPTPTNVSSLRSFLGLVNFVSKFVPSSTDILYLLNNLLKKNIPWNWSESQEHAFQSIKNEICKATNLRYYDPKLELVLENDASEYGLGSSLTQNLKPLAYASRSLSPSERNYAQIEKELLHLCMGCKSSTIMYMAEM